MPSPFSTADAAFPADLRLPSLEALRAFEAAARLGSFERAAELLHITASAVSKRVATLEELLGTPLLQRSAKALQLTAQGREYLQAVRPALQQLAAVPLHRRGTQQRQRLRLCCPPTLARQILVPALPSYTESHPEIELEIVLSVPFLADGGSDADLEVRHGAPLGATNAVDGVGAISAISGGGPASPAPSSALLDNKVLMFDLLVPLASPALLASEPSLREPADLARLPLLRSPMDPWSPWFAAVGLDWPEPDQGPRLVDLGLMLEAALQGQGVVLARPSLARQALQAGWLQPVFGRGSTPWVPAKTFYQLANSSDTTAAAEAAAPPRSGPAAGLADWLHRACAAAAAEGLALISGGA